MQHSTMINNVVLSKINMDGITAPHTLIELSTIQWERYKNNCSIVKNTIVDKSMKRCPIVTYNEVIHGRHTKVKGGKITSQGKALHSKNVLFHHLPSSFMMVATKKDELVNSNKESITIDGSRQQMNVNTEEASHAPSGMVILFLDRLQRQVNISSNAWGESDCSSLKGCKDNITKGHSSHFGSTGFYYSFENSANYGMLNNSSVT